MDDNIQPGALDGADIGAKSSSGDGAEPKTSGDGAEPKINGATEKDDEKKTATAKKAAADKKASETRRQMDEWLAETADKVIKIVSEDAALRFHDADLDDEEQHGALDLEGKFDPVIDGEKGADGVKTSALLSEMLVAKAREFREVLPQGQSEEALRRMYKSKLKTKWGTQTLTSELPGTKIGKRYLANRIGVWVKSDVSPGLDELFVWRRFVRTQIEPSALSRDTSQQRNWRHRYLITDETGPFKVEVDKAALGKHANSAINKLMRHGVHVIESKESRETLAQYLRFKPKARVIRAPRVGWFEPEKGKWVFVLPDKTLGNAGKDTIVLDVAKPGHYGFDRAGTANEWREHVAAPHAGNSNVALTVGTFLAAPLLCWAGEPGGLFHLHAREAKIGKTLAAAIGQSVWGLPYFPGAGSDTFGYSWESTANRLGERATLRSDAGVGLDEIGIGAPDAIGKAAYALAGGIGKGRYGETEAIYNILGISTGEMSLAEFLKKARQGQLVRIADVPAEVQVGSAFETIPQNEIAAAGRQFYAATKKYHGAVGHEWLEHLVKLGPARIKDEIERLREIWLALPEVVKIADRARPHVMSVIGRFALVAITLRLAAGVGIVPWSFEEIDNAIIACMERWISQSGNTDEVAELHREVRRRRQTIDVKKGFVHLVREKRKLVPASPADKRLLKSKKFDGVALERTSGEVQFLVLPETWQRWWDGLPDVDAVKEHLKSEKLLIPDRKGDVPSVEKIDRKSRRVYVLAAAFTK